MPAKGGVPVADYELDIQRYQDDHRKLLHGVTLVSAAGYRHCKASSTAIHTLTVKDGDDVACTFYLREHDLYLVGFKNRLEVVLNWAWNYFAFSRGARLIVGKDWRSAGGPAPAPRAVVEEPSGTTVPPPATAPAATPAPPPAPAATATAVPAPAPHA